LLHSSPKKPRVRARRERPTVFVWTDIETTGRSPVRDEILALGMIITDDKMRELARQEWVVHVPSGWKSMREMSDYVHAMHVRSGLLERVADSRLLLADVEREACEFLAEHLGAPDWPITNRPPMAGSSVHFDRTFLVVHMPALLEHFSYRNLDVSSFKVLAIALVDGARELNAARKEPAHTPLADLEGSIAELAQWLRVLSGASL
jgi:oligoribonuclease